MVRRKRLTDSQVQALPMKAKRYFHSDAELNGHYIRVAPTGAKTFVCTARNPHGKQVWATVGGCDLWKIEDSREECRKIIKRIQAGLEAIETPKAAPESYRAIAENWFNREVIER